MAKLGGKWWRRIRRVVLVGLVVVLVLGGLFVANGLDGSWRTPELHRSAEKSKPARAGAELRILAFNIAKCFMHEGGTRFADVSTIEARLERIAKLIDEARADLVFLSEVVIESGPAPVNQAKWLAERCGFAFCATGENYSFGLPFYRIRSGNALLSRNELRPHAVFQLAGKRPFWNPTNNRRILWCELHIGDEWLLAASLRNDSFSLANNRVHMEEIRSWLGERPALLAGDFNADPETPQMQALKKSGRFSGVIEGAPTFPSHRPERRLDYVLAPSSWTLVEERVIESEVSDHRPVLSVYRLP